MFNYKKYNIIGKIFLRLKFILFESYGKNIDAILCSLKSSDKRSGESLAKLLSKRGIIKWDRAQKLIIFNNTKIYNDNLPITDFLGISLYNVEYIKKIFLRTVYLT